MKKRNGRLYSVSLASDLLMRFGLADVLMDDLISTVSKVGGTSNIPMLFKLMNGCPVADVSISSRLASCVATIKDVYFCFKTMYEKVMVGGVHTHMELAYLLPFGDA